MKPLKRDSSSILYEKVSTEDFVAGIIEEVQYQKEHIFKGYGKDENGNPRPDKKLPATRFKFKLEGCEYPHYSKWMFFGYSEKSNLYLKFLVPLVEGAKPDMDFDLDQLKGMKVKTLWVNKGDFQHIETIRPIGKKITPLNVTEDEPAEIHEADDGSSVLEEPPF